MTLARRRRKLTSGGRIPGKAIGLGLVAGLFVGIGYLCGGPSSIPATQQNDALTTPEGVPIVRVRLIAKATTVKLDAGDGKGVVTYAADDVKSPLTIAPPANGGLIVVEEKHYRGSVRLIPNAASSTTPASGEAPTLDVVNIVSVEEYLRGVVPSEMPAAWPDAALRSQAVAARTYAVYMIKSREAATARAKGDDDDDVGPPSRSYDLVAGTASQAFQGTEKESPASDAAVQATRGIVLTDGPAGQQKIFCALFSACCGGATLGGDDYINGDPTPALAAHLGDGCTASRVFDWPEFSIRKDELTRRVRLWGQRKGDAVANCGAIRAVTVAQRNAFDRPTRFAIVDDAGTRYVLRSEQFRNACNTDGPPAQQFLSAFFTPVDAGDSIRITAGHGSGHGVGLCQWCANGWAKRGLDVKQILAASYPGAVLVRAY